MPASGQPTQGLPTPPVLAARDLPIEDQISLLKGATFEMCILRFNTMFDTETGTWECGRLAYCFQDPDGAQEMPTEGDDHGERERLGGGGGELSEGRLGSGVRFLRCWLPILCSPTGGFQKLLLDPVMKFHCMLKKLQLHKEEYVLMQAISLFSPGDGSSPSCWAPPGLCRRRQHLFLSPQERSQSLALLSTAPSVSSLWRGGWSELLSWAGLNLPSLRSGLPT